MDGPYMKKDNFFYEYWIKETIFIKHHNPINTNNVHFEPKTLQSNCH